MNNNVHHYILTSPNISLDGLQPKSKLFSISFIKPHQFQISGLTHSISMFTEGIIEMKSTLVGVIKVRRCCYLSKIEAKAF